ncbi:MAG TPA: glycosyltransferase family 1 protein, partial [Vicinamibacterales bacterium]|nr:glycosyltransferase family 1 protein [Vicinamibacterales bacterium]
EALDLILFTEPARPLHPAFHDLLGPNARIETPSAPRAVIWEQVALPRALRRLDVDVFHAPADGGLPGWKHGRYVLTYHRALDKSVMHWIANGELPGGPRDYGLASGGVLGWSQQARHNFFRRLYLQSADAIIAVSAFCKWELVELLGVREDKVEVIPLAADEMFTADLPPARVVATRVKYGLPDRYLIYVGGFDAWKNVDGLLRAVAEARRTGVAEALVLAGFGGEVDHLRTLASTLGFVEGRDIFFLGRIHDDLPALYHGATALVSLSWGESFPFPILEAMSCGTPVVASKRGGTPELVRDAGLLVDPRSANETVGAMISVTNESVRRDLRARGLARACAYSWRQTAQRTAAVYERLLSPAPRTAH